MSQTVRSILAVAAGVVVAFALVSAIEAIGQAVYPVPAGLDFANPEQMRAYIRGLPVGALMFVLAAWVGASFGGGVVAAFLARTKPLLHAGIVGAFVVAATIANLIMIAHPAWFAVTGVIGIVVGAFVAGRLAAARTRR